VHALDAARSDLIQALRLSPTSEEAQRELADVEQVSAPAVPWQVVPPRAGAGARPCGSRAGAPRSDRRPHERAGERGGSARGGQACAADRRARRRCRTRGGRAGDAERDGAGAERRGGRVERLLGVLGMCNGLYLF
jgi:hypothetical protein